jgi:hypothetical protein
LKKDLSVLPELPVSTAGDKRLYRPRFPARSDRACYVAEIRLPACVETTRSGGVGQSGDYALREALGHDPLYCAVGDRPVDPRFRGGDGDLDQVKAEIEQLKTLGGEGDLEWFGWFFDQGFMPWEEEMRQMELFAEHIIPAFR